MTQVMGTSYLAAISANESSPSSRSHWISIAKSDILLIGISKQANQGQAQQEPWHKQTRIQKVSLLRTYLNSLSTWIQFNMVGGNVKDYPVQLLEYNIYAGPTPHYTLVLQTCQVLFLVNLGVDKSRKTCYNWWLIRKHIATPYSVQERLKHRKVACKSLILKG